MESGATISNGLPMTKLQFDSIILSLAAAMIMLTVGCGEPGPKTYPVSGTVTLDRQPLTDGKIFLIDPAMKLDSDVGDVVDGEFRFRAKAGSKRVEIRAARATGQIGNFGSPITEEALPDRYNSNSILKAEVTTEAHKNVYEFALKSE